MISDLTNIDMSVVEKVIRTLGVYLSMLVLIRIFGKRLMAQMNSQDLVVVLLLSNVVQNAIIGNETSLLGGLIGAVTLVLANWLLDLLAERVPAVDRLINGRATTVVVEGAPDSAALQRLSITPHELLVALHEQGADSIEEVQRATLEPGGAMLVEIAEGSRGASKDDLVRAMEQLREHLDARLDRMGAPHA